MRGSVSLSPFMSSVPSVKRIVYSTCSIHATENEHVVSQALKSEEATSGPFTLAPRQEVLPLWQRRGLEEEMDFPGTGCLQTILEEQMLTVDVLRTADAESLIRCSPGEDATNGFFVSLLVRRPSKKGTQQSITDIVGGEKRKEMEDDDAMAPKTKRRKKKKKANTVES